MGLKNQALHVMLANPHLSPFEVIDRPESKCDWMLVDHLITRFRVKETDYVEGDRVRSIWNMARTLADLYIRESWTAECLVLVRDGHGAQKPAVRPIRDRYQPAPHIDFCRRNADAIDYLTLKLLCEANVPQAVFIVTGQEWSCAEALGEPEYEWPVYLVQYDTNGICTADKPTGFLGAFVSTVATVCAKGHLVFLGAACKKSVSTEADTLLVELANSLPGTAMVCTSDSDVIAVLTACGREGLTLRLTNTSYTSNRPMHTSVFGDMLMDSLSCVGLNDVNFQSSELRLQALYDVKQHDNVGGYVEERHGEWEQLLQLALGQSADAGSTEIGVQRVAQYLYQGGIRGSVYGEFLHRVTALPTDRKNDLAKIIVTRTHDCRVNTPKCTFHETFELFHDCCAGTAAPPIESNKSKRPHDDRLTDHGPTAKNVEIGQKQMRTSMHRLSKLYAEGKVPRYSNGRYLRLSAMSSHLHIRIKSEVLESESVKHKHLVFMILFGTDYTRTFQGLGPKGLVKVGMDNSFGSWCEELNTAWLNPATSFEQYHALYNKLAIMSKIAGKRIRCDGQLASLTFRTMRYVYEMWRLADPKADESYGFHVDENNTMTFI